MKNKGLLGILSGCLFVICAGANASLTHTKTPNNATLSATDIPLYFVENSGQVNPSVAYYSKTPDFTLWLSPDALVFDRNIRTSPNSEESARDLSRMTFPNSNDAPSISSLGETQYKVNYYQRDGSRWKTDIDTFQAVSYNEIYDGIDLKIYGVTSSIEYDWIVKPGSRPNAISFKYNDIESSQIDGAGNIVINTRFSKMVHKRPFAYQTINGKQVAVDVGFNELSENVYGFSVGAYNKSVELVIDPVVLTYSTYLGGATNPGDVYAFPQDYGKAIAVNGGGNAYVTGSTKSTDFPTANAYDTTLDSYTDTGDTIYPDDLFVTKFSADGNSLLFSTYIGGSRADEGRAIAVDAAGNAYVTGSTQSSDFPTTAGVVSTTKNDASTSSTDAFVVKLSSSGAMVYSTFLGGDASDVGNGIAVDASGNAHIVGSTYSTDLPLQGAYDSTVNLYWNAGAGEYRAYSTLFVTKLNSTATAVGYSSYFGSGQDAESLSDEGNAIALDGSGNIYLTGITKSSQFPLKNAYDSTYQGYPANSTDFSEAVVLKVDPSLSGANSLVFSTFLGGTGGDWGYGIDLDDSGEIYVAGMTRSSDFPTAGPYQSSHGGGSNDGFVAKLNYAGSTLSLVYSTYLGGSGNDTIRAIAVNGDGYAFVTGDTDGSDFPISNAYDGTYSASQDVFVTLLVKSGSTLEYSTYLGSTGQDSAYGIALDSSNAAYIVGSTSSTDFPTVGPYMTNPADGTTQDAFVSKLSYAIVEIPAVTTTTGSSISSSSAASGGNVTSNGGAGITSRGVCWSTSVNPVAGGSDSCTSDGTGTGSYTSTLTSLSPNTTYHYRAYAVNSKGTGYGADKSFTTPKTTPSLTTTTTSSITGNAASSGGDVTSNGGASVTARGVCWSTSANPVAGGTDSCTTNGTGTGAFTSSLSGLSPGTTYHYRAYATNSEGTAYGTDKSFTTPLLPTVTTATASSITNDSAASGGNVTSDGGASVTARGVCWSTSANPVTGGADSCTTNGSGPGNFTGLLTSLTAGVSYHYRAYATNSVGTAYGDDRTFTTLSPDLILIQSNDTGGSAVLGGSWTWTLSLRNTGDYPATFADGQVLLTAQLPATDITYGATRIANVTAVTNQAFLSATITANTLTVSALGGSVSVGASTGRFDARFTVVPSATRTFTSPTSGGICKADPNAVVIESNEANNSATDTVTTSFAPAPNIGHDGEIVSGENVANNSSHANIEIHWNTTVTNNGILTHLTNNGTVIGGEVSGSSTNSGALFNVTIGRQSSIDNLGGMVSDGRNLGEVYGGTIHGNVHNEGVIHGGAPADGGDGADYSVIVATDAVVEGGTLGGVVTTRGELRDVTLRTNSVIRVENDSSGASGRLTGTITIVGNSATGTITIPSGVSFPPPNSGTLVLTPQMLVAYANDHGWFREGYRARNLELPELDDDLLIVAGMIMSPEGITSLGELSVNLAYDPSLIPNGLTQQDLELKYYDPDSSRWIGSNFESSGAGAIRFTTVSASAYALVLPTTDTASPILNVQPTLDPTGRQITLSGIHSTDVTAAPTLLVPEDRMNETAFLFMCLELEDGALWCYQELSGSPNGPNLGWRVHAEGDPIPPFKERRLDNPQLTFDANLANLDMAATDTRNVNIYIAISRTETLADFRGSAYRLTFEPEERENRSSAANAN